MNVFGGTIDGEKNKIIQDSYKSLKTDVDEINKLILIQKKSIVENSENINKLKLSLDEINKVIVKILSRVNTIEVYFKDRPIESSKT